MVARLSLRSPKKLDATEFLEQVSCSRDVHGLWVSPPDSEEKFLAWLTSSELDTVRSFLVCNDSALAGVVNVTNIVRGNFCSAYLGYYVFAGAEGQGVMSWALRKVCGIAFKEMGLHRLEANIQPGNEASIALAKRCGFQCEGYSPRYLKVRGRWRDHERWALVRP